MLIIMTMTALFIIAALATAMSLLDTWMRARFFYRVLNHEKSLLEAGFMPEVEAQKIRLRQREQIAAPSSRRRARHRAGRQVRQPRPQLSMLA